MKKITIFIKTVAAAMASLLLVSMLLLGYSFNFPHVSNEGGNTDFKWVGNTFFVNGHEGYGFGVFDSNGFNNIKYIENPDVVIVGSSHMEATHVLQKQMTASRLMKHLQDNNKDYTVYNMGVAGHNFRKVCSYLPETFNCFEHAPKYLIIETETTTITANDSTAILNHDISVQSSYSSGLIGFLQKIPLLRVLYSQYIRGLVDRFLPDSILISSNNDGGNSSDYSGGDTNIDSAPYDVVMDYISSFESTFGTKIIIFYHPTEVIEPSGNVYFPIKNTTSVFSECADKSNIHFLDMTNAFSEGYLKNYKLPHGFITGAIGTGHLNAYGHDLIATELCKLILSIEEGH